ncbi:ATP-binding protein [Novosphingobium sp. KCTC 2891]|uniref:ATP-binding protein n=1 Tax=Novosphingobium sp. KCTC 2891 TaxID=2989730 RepID=UPI002223D544|nr:ATP-binding protein [Novosphingobium sp. KCTC 2891]MCW1382531.1 ATP-binding protein [Novosphingobium sp. KCTC 2891]
MKLYSLRRATLGALVLPMLVALAVAAGSGLLSARRTIAILRDHAMQQEAAFLLTLSLHEAAEGEQLGTIHNAESGALGELRAQGIGFRIWSGDRVMTVAGALPQAGKWAPAPGFADVALQGRPWRRYVMRDPQLPILVEVAEPAAVRDSMMWRMGASVAGPLLLLVLAVSMIASYRVAGALRPLDRISQGIRARHEDDLSPLEGDVIPQEIAPLVDAVNDLLGRLGAALRSERAFSDNAAHELRTPLAILKTRAQLVQQALSGVAGQEHQAAALVEATDRATAVIEQLLLLSRLQSGLSRFAPVDLSDLATRVAQDLAGGALTRGHDVEARIAAGVTVSGNADALAMLVRNLFENAVRHVPAGGWILIEVDRTQAGEPVLRLVDNGPGLPPGKLDLAFERFTRFPGGSAEGTGLGLSIVKQIALSHGARVALRNRLEGGLECEVVFPLAAPSS